MKYYEYLWWTIDATASLHFRVFRMDKHGYILPLITEDNIYQLLAKRHLDSSVEYKEIKAKQLIENE